VYCPIHTYFGLFIRLLISLVFVCVFFSLQNFVRGAGGFVSEMATAVLNGLTNNRHSSFVQKLNTFEEKESKKPRPTTNKEAPPEEAKEPDVKKEDGNSGKESCSSAVAKLEDSNSDRTEKSLADNADGSSLSSRESRSREVSLELSNGSDTPSTQLKCAELGLDTRHQLGPVFKIGTRWWLRWIQGQLQVQGSQCGDFWPWRHPI